jgi:phosphonate transport system substrate-binding protein
VWENELKAGKIDLNKVKVIWSTPTYPDYQWTVRGDVNERHGDDFIAKLTVALLNMSDKSLLESFPRQGFIAASNADYEPIKRVATAINLL